MKKSTEKNNLKDIINATEHNIAALMTVKSYEEEKGECTCSLNEMALDMQTSLLVFKGTIDEELLEYHFHQVIERSNKFHEYLN
jgi:hypothetical protein